VGAGAAVESEAVEALPWVRVDGLDGLPGVRSVVVGDADGADAGVSLDV
jgi:hypothetical protein